MRLLSEPSQLSSSLDVPDAVPGLLVPAVYGPPALRPEPEKGSTPAIRFEPEKEFPPALRPEPEKGCAEVGLADPGLEAGLEADCSSLRREF